VIERALAVGLRTGPPAPSGAADAPAGRPAAARRAAEEAALAAALATHRGSREELARALGISLRTLYRRLGALHQRA
jgi:DNA-binding NtrC family response regulator